MRPSILTVAALLLLAGVLGTPMPALGHAGRSMGPAGEVPPSGRDPSDPPPPPPPCLDREPPDPPPPPPCHEPDPDPGPDLSWLGYELPPIPGTEPRDAQSAEARGPAPVRSE